MEDSQPTIHVIPDEDSQSILSLFEQSDTNSILDQDDRFSRVLSGNFPDSTQAHIRYQRKSLEIPKRLPTLTTPELLESIDKYETHNTAVNTKDNTHDEHQKYSYNKTWSGLPGGSRAQSKLPTEAIKDDIRALRAEFRREMKTKNHFYARVADLEAKVELLQRRISLLKGSEHPITPDALPEPNEYYRLQLDQADSMGHIQLANIVKNMLILFNTPLSTIQQFIPALAKLLDQDDHYLQFTDKIHRHLYNEPFNPSRDSEEIRVCLEKMVEYINYRGNRGK